MTGGGGVKSGEVEVDYVIRRGEQIEAYAVRDGRVSLVQ
jgi:hypothetical protein